MKNLSVLILLIVSFVLFLVGVSVPGTGRPLHIIFVVAATTLGFVFYLITFMRAIKTPSLSQGRRIFWIVAIICLPVIGSVLFTIIHDADVTKQIPKPQV